MPNKVEDKAIDFVMKYEQKAGREPKRLPDGKSYDIKSTQRCIEVKGLTCKDLPSNIQIHPTILKKLRGDVSHYDYLGVLFLGLLKVMAKLYLPLKITANKWQKERDYFCSELCFEAFYRGGGLDIVPDIPKAGGTR